MSPRVSVLTRTRNRPVLLARAVDSVASQTFVDYELIIVNDAGDAAPVDSLVESLDAEFRSRVRVIHKETSHGMEAATNTAFAASRGEYVAILDDDDTWAPDFLATTVDYLDAHPDLVAAATRADVVTEVLDDEGHPTETGRELFASNQHSWNLPEVLVQNYVPIHSQLVRSEVARRIGGWNESMATQGDWDFSLRLLAAGPAGFIDGEPLAHWHHRLNATGDLGNSVYVASESHVTDNLDVRDRYLRDAVARQDTRPDLGAALQTALYYRRLLEESRTETERLHQALAAAHADLAKHIKNAEESLLMVHERIGAIQASVHETNQVLYAIRANTVRSRLGRRVRRLRGRG